MNATVRTFRAPDAASALKAVKAALGSDAVILNTRECPGTLFRRPEIEVTAALTPPAPAEPAPRPAPRAVPALPPLAPVPPPVAYPPADGASAVEMAGLRRALEDARHELQLLRRRGRAERELELSPSAAELYETLVFRGVEEALAEELVRQALYEGVPSRQQPLWSAVEDLVACRLIAARPPWLPDRRRVIALVGPTGAGKTTTIAKIAARALLDSSCKVALVTVDTYRVGASDQLARYGAIMRVPASVARDGDELRAAVQRYADADLVLIDTAGRSLSEAVARQAEMIRNVPGVELHLVLSAASGARDIAAVCERYRALTPERLVFTKVDEAAAPGGLLSAAVRINRPVACMADGQRVPEDLQAPTSAALCALVMGQARGEAGAPARRT